MVDVYPPIDSIFHCCKFLRETKDEILEIIHHCELDKIITVLTDIVINLFADKIPYQDLIISDKDRQISDFYFGKEFSDALELDRNIKSEFIIVKDSGPALNDKLRLVQNYLKSSDSPNPEQIDYDYYVNDLLRIYIDPLISYSFAYIICQLSNVSYQPTNKSNKIYLDEPIKILMAMRKRGYRLDVFKEAVRYNYRKLINSNNKSKVVESNPEICQNSDKANKDNEPHENINKGNIESIEKPKKKKKKKKRRKNNNKISSNQNSKIESSKQPNATIFVDKNMSTPWSLSNPGRWVDIANSVRSKYRIGKSKNIKMENTPEECFKMVVTQIEKAPEGSKINLCITEDMSYMAYWTM